MVAADQLATKVGTAPAGRALGVARSSWYQRRRPKVMIKPRPQPERALTPVEREEVLKVWYSERFMDKTPAEAYTALLDEGVYLCSIRTMYRILAENHAARDRRNQRRHPNYVKPELLATAPHQVWSWDITKLKGPVKWSYFCLYVIMDSFSRYVVGWMIAYRESATLAKRLSKDTYEKQGITGEGLTLHADRGTSMTAKTVALLLADLGVTKTHSRPHVSDDNPYSEAQFRTLKYRPDFPDRFGSIEDARVFCQGFFSWYNAEHYHSGIGMLTPEMLHYGQAKEVVIARQKVLAEAYAAHPERFVRRPPKPADIPDSAWINKPWPQMENERVLQ